MEHADVVLVHDPDFRQAEKDWHSFVENMTETLITIDDTIPELPIKDVVSVLFWRGSAVQRTVVIMLVKHRSFAYIETFGSLKTQPHVSWKIMRLHRAISMLTEN